MTKLLRSALASVVLLLGAAHAAPSGTDYSDLWWNPAQGGWGLSLQRQGDVIFAALYTYDADGRPTWYVASDVRPTAPAPGPDRWAGTLYRVSGAPFSGGHDAAPAVSPVGPFSLAFDDDRSGRVEYAIDGVASSSAIARQTWRVPAIAAAYRGGFSTLASSCRDPNFDGVFEFAGASTLSESGGTATLRIVSTTFAGFPSTCTFNGTRTQAGRLGRLEGEFNCALYTGTDVRGENPSVVSRRGTFRIEGLEATSAGFSGSLVASDQDCRYEGQVGGVRTDPAAARDYSDLWWNPAEPGWGAHLTLQGDVLFAVLFVHDAARHATFLVASDMRPAQDAGGTIAFEGTLYRTAGSASGIPYDPSRFSAKAVGKARIVFDALDRARISYQVDGISVTKAVSRQTWSADEPSGRYLGGLESAASGCNFGTGAPALSFPGTVQVMPSGNTITIDTRFDPGFAELGTCRYVGVLGTSGSVSSVTAGTFGCEFSNGISFGGDFEMSDLRATPTGFTAGFRGTTGSCRMEGRFGAFRQVEAPAPTMAP